MPLAKLIRCGKLIFDNGGPFKAFYKLWRFDTLKDGQLMGTDEFGNKYYENHYYMLGRSRWVEHNPNVKWNYDATQVTAEWFGWLHYRTDRLPSEDYAKVCLSMCPASRLWLKPHEENMSGTKKAYYPYSTTPPNIYVWDGYNIVDRPCYELPSA